MLGKERSVHVCMLMRVCVCVFCMCMDVNIKNLEREGSLRNSFRYVAAPGFRMNTKRTVPKSISVLVTFLNALSKYLTQSAQGRRQWSKVNGHTVSTTETLWARDAITQLAFSFSFNLRP